MDCATTQRGWLLWLAAAALAGCSGSSGSDGGALDQLVLLDGGLDRALRFDRGVDASADLPLDLQLDFPPPSDVLPPALTVLYTATQNTSSFGLSTVALGGSPQPVTGWEGLLDLDPLRVVGEGENPPVRADRPRVTVESAADFRGVRLPGGLGTLYYVHRTLTASSGLLLVKLDGQLELLLEVAGLYSDLLSGDLAFALDASLGAVVKQKSSVLLFRSDGTTFADGKSWVEITGNGIQSLKPASLRLASDRLLCVGNDGSKDQLYHAPLDGSTPLSPLSLQGAGDYIAEDLLLDPARQLVVLKSGAGSGQVAPMVHQLQQGKTTTLGEVGSLGSAGPLGLPPGPQLAISPQGKMVAYLRFNAGEGQLVVAPSDGSASEQVITAAPHFQEGIASIANLLFADDQSLLFMAGVSSYQHDLFLWDTVSKSAQNITGHGTTKAPFDGYGAFYPAAAWLSPDGKWFYWAEQDSSTSVTDLRGLELASKTLSKVTQGAEVATLNGLLRSCSQGSQLYFVAEPIPNHNNQEIWRFDQSSGAPATRLTTMSTSPTKPWGVMQLVLTPDCSALAWTAGGASTLQHLYAAPSAAMSSTPVTLIPKYFERGLLLSPNGASAAFGSGSPGSASLKAAAISPGAPELTLDPSGGAVHIFAVY